jgi:signal transduction histidine kinase
MVRIDSESAGEARFRRRIVAVMVTSFFLADGVLRAIYRYLETLTVGGDRLFLDAFVSELTSSLAAAVGFFLVIVPACRRWPLRGLGWPRHLVAHLGGLAVYSTLKTLVMWGSRIVVFPIVGLGRYDYGDLSFRFWMEGAGDVLGYTVLAGAVHAWDAWKRSKERELRTARLEAQLTAARLAALKSQLHPHFLFNTLNTIASLVHSEPEAADRMITRLSDLLRRALDAPAGAEITVLEEVESLREYVEIMRARFGDRLSVAVAVEPAVREARVPPFLVQPLVENAIRHGVGPRLEGGRIDVRFGSSNARLEIVVRDDGPGLAPGANGGSRGVGIANTRDRLRMLYGPEGTLLVSNGPDGGVVCHVALPLRAGDDEEAGS